LDAILKRKINIFVVFQSIFFSSSPSDDNALYYLLKYYCYGIREIIKEAALPAGSSDGGNLLDY
jgi:hypothetical protein